MNKAFMLATVFLATDCMSTPQSYTYNFCAPLLILDDSFKESPHTAGFIKKLDGRKTTDPDDELTQYLKDSGENSVLKFLPATNGYLFIKAGEVGLSMCATYSLKREISAEEMAALIKYTKGQISDGVGEFWIPYLQSETNLTLEVDYEKLQNVK
jgi:hypothetical protein